MGLLFIQAVQFADIPVMAAYLCLIALIFVVINLVVDLLYFAVDPRLRIERPTAGTEIHGMNLSTPPHRRRAGTLPRRRRLAQLPHLAGGHGGGGDRAGVPGLRRVRALGLAPHNPFDLASLNLIRRAPAAGLDRRRQPQATCWAPTTRAATSSRR
jgi:hypothetical protein